MENFTFYNPTKIEFRTDKEQQIDLHLIQSGVKKVLFCYRSERIKRDRLFTIIKKQFDGNQAWLSLTSHREVRNKLLAELSSPPAPSIT